MHRAKLADQEQTEGIKHEIELVDECIAAPHRPFLVNFAGAAEEEVKNGKHMSSLALKD